MFHESWSAQVGQDPRLGYLWWGMHGLAAGAVGLSGVALHWPALMSLAVFLVSGFVLYRLGRQMPTAWFRPGYLVLDGQGARWRDGAGRLVEGEVVWLWTGPNLVGLLLSHPEGQLSLWLTRRRVGDTAWWQLQRWLRFEQAGA